MKTFASALKPSLALSAAVIGLLAGAALANAAEVVPALHDALPEAYRANGIKIAAFNDWPPDEFMENGELKGWSIDMAKAMSERLGVPFHFTGTSFDAIIPGLVAKRFDVGFSSFGVTPERLDSLDFVPQRMEGTAYAFPSSKSYEIDSEDDLCGHSVAVMTGAWDYQYLLKVSKATCTDAGKPAIDLQQFTSQNAAELAVSSGRVEMVGAGSAKLMYLAKQTGKFKVSTLISNPVQNGIGLRSGDPLGPVLRDTLQAMIDDGSYKEILDKWGVGGGGLLTKAVLVTKADPDPK
ncbi:ABC transporter substrate-binding protein [Aureimonas psammosilenae]|uniref:ABC transporter substrate-binding protein n=1 Tax=Aureimonas psammosilenae TaxID=2495496 RepID=UPI0012611563|nr:ABC transporter substrate-binding protein [Aureimonas psammosilenae]